MAHFQYQEFASPIAPAAETVTESRWHQPWSEPVRFRIDPRAKIAIDSWLYRLVPAEPFGEDPLESKFHFHWSEPVRLPKGLRPWYQQFECDDAIPNPEPEHFADAWIPALTLPVREPVGLRAWYHPFLFQSPRMLATPNVFMTLDATEINDDVFSGGFVIGGPGISTAVVSIKEIPAQSGAALSVEES